MLSYKSEKVHFIAKHSAPSNDCLKKEMRIYEKKNLFPFKCAMYISIDIIFRYICCGLSSHSYFFWNFSDYFIMETPT